MNCNECDVPKLLNEAYTARLNTQLYLKRIQDRVNQQNDETAPKTTSYFNLCNGLGSSSGTNGVHLPCIISKSPSS